MGSERWLFDVVIRVRPDDLWFGPLLPHCVMKTAAPRVLYDKNNWRDRGRMKSRQFSPNVTTRIGTRGGTVFVARQAKRETDQFYIMPRHVAQTFLNAVKTEKHLKPVCSSAKGNIGIVNRGGIPFETLVFTALRDHTIRGGAKYKPTLFPRILSRLRCVPSATQVHCMKGTEKEAKQRCERFLWFVSRDKCVRALFGSGSTNAFGDIDLNSSPSSDPGLKRRKEQGSSVKKQKQQKKKKNIQSVPVLYSKMAMESADLERFVSWNKVLVGALKASR